VTYDEMACFARALAHPARMRIIGLLSYEKECLGPQVFGELELAQSTVSEHLRVLKEAGVIDSRPVGATTAYRLLPCVLERYAVAVADIVESADTHGPGRA